MLTVHAQRGQTFPIWAFGSLSLMVLLAVVVNYGNMLVWQFRAQNAADAAARGVLTAQTTQWNQTIATLHAAAVEEYRIRNILQDLVYVVNDDGGCAPPPATIPDPTSCDQMYINLRAQYLDAVQRYTNDVSTINNVASTTQATQISNMNEALALFRQNCGTASGGDCGFNYKLVATTPRNNNFLEDVYSDCCSFVVGGGTSGNPKPDLTPLQVEVVACANVPTAFPSFFNFQAPQFLAIGRAAATSIMSTQEFEYVGSIVNPTTNAVFQPSEYPESTNGSAVLSGSDANYRIDYGGNPDDPLNGGNPATSNGKADFQYTPGNPGLLVATGWWGAMPIPTFASKLTAGTSFTCK